MDIVACHREGKVDTESLSLKWDSAESFFAVQKVSDIAKVLHKNVFICLKVL
jgi:hypothetical protein